MLLHPALAFSAASVVHLTPRYQLHRPQGPSACVSAPSRRADAHTDLAFAVSHFEAAALLTLKPQAPISGAQQVTGPFSIDLGFHTQETLIVLPEGIGEVDERTEQQHTLATWKELQSMSKRGRTGAFELFRDGSAPMRIAGLSATSQRALSLLPVKPMRPPTLVVAGFTMHRMRDTDPGLDTLEKVAALRPHGRVLDVCTGLGYTAVRMGTMDEVSEVVTVERDEGVVEIQGRNPWSKGLFEMEKVRRVEMDAVEFVRGVEDEWFDTVLHDPPARVLGGELFAQSFYMELARVMRVGGRLFHYIGDPESRESGRLYDGVVRRLREAGFERVDLAKKAFGVTAVRGKKRVR